MTTETTITSASGQPLAEWVSVNDHNHDQETGVIIGTLIEFTTKQPQPEDTLKANPRPWPPVPHQPEAPALNTPFRDEKPGPRHFYQAFLK